MTLYQITQEYEAALNAITTDPDTGEVIGMDALDAIQGTFEEKIDNTACYIKNQQALASALAQEAKALTDRKKAIDNKVERLKANMTAACEALERDTVETPRCNVSFRSSTSVEVLDPYLIPLAYTSREETVKVDKKAIAKAIKDGITVEGAVLVAKNNIQIK